MNENDFEWDEKKAARNNAEHGISFEVARYVFDDPTAVEELDGREHYGEDRYNITGIVGGRLLVVTYTIRRRTRIISARLAAPHERKRYHEKARNSHP
ncbi:MAG: BrnT family toxin [Rhodomicrobium sp.]